MATQAQLRGRAQRLADMENSDYVDADEWRDYLNEGLNELHDILIRADADYNITSTVVSLVSGTTQYNLPDDYYKLRGVDYQVTAGNGTVYALRPFMFRERNRYQFVGGAATPDNIYRYHIRGNGLGGTEIAFEPEPRGGGSVTVWYVPKAAELVDDSDSTPVYIPGGFEKFIVLHMALRALQKEDAGGAETMFREKSVEMARIEKLAAPRDNNEPKRMVDVLDWLDDDGPLPWGL